MLHYLRENRSWMQLLFMSDQKIFPPATTVWLPHSLCRGFFIWTYPHRTAIIDYSLWLRSCFGGVQQLEIMVMRSLIFTVEALIITGMQFGNIVMNLVLNLRPDAGNGEHTNV